MSSTTWRYFSFCVDELLTSQSQNAVATRTWRTRECGNIPAVCDQTSKSRKGKELCSCKSDLSVINKHINRPHDTSILSFNFFSNMPTTMIAWHKIACRLLTLSGLYAPTYIRHVHEYIEILRTCRWSGRKPFLYVCFTSVWWEWLLEYLLPKSWTFLPVFVCSWFCLMSTHVSIQWDSGNTTVEF